MALSSQTKIVHGISSNMIMINFMICEGYLVCSWLRLGLIVQLWVQLCKANNDEYPVINLMTYAVIFSMHSISPFWLINWWLKQLVWNWFGPAGLLVLADAELWPAFVFSVTSVAVMAVTWCGCMVWGEHKIIVPKLGLGGDDGEADVSVMWWVWVLGNLPFKQSPCAVKWENHLGCSPWICSEMRCWDGNLGTGPGLGCLMEGRDAVLWTGLAVCCLGQRLREIAAV